MATRHTLDISLTPELEDRSQRQTQRSEPLPASDRRTRVFGIDRGRFQVPDDFDAPLPEEIFSEDEE